ncbi:MAG TPA: D-2-hydroxyacid dehydrogenase [Chthoniobacterales bacterium]|jgi:phosphoglycerate dehydrogenase-like enzyme|nr:D-2-hydroxyacid dehydrogenase [Chthoniobacterales bacterium]
MNELTIWANPLLTRSAKEYLVDATRQHQLVFGEKTDHVLDPGSGDPRMQDGEVVFGQPDPATVIQSKKLRWIHLSSAGYAPYDTPGFRNGLKALSAILTNSSGVFDEPCAQHLMAWLLADARQLYPSYDNQRESRAWPQNDLREKARLLADQTILIVGYGAIGRRLAELLAPFSARVIGYRRSPQPESPIRVVGPEKLQSAMAEADHVINILPQSEETQSFFNAERLRQIKQGARYYAIGRGATTDQEALLACLHSGHLSAVYLDVTTPEPLPSNHALWSAPNCFITPHTGGGHADETLRIVKHFVHNLHRFERGESLLDRVF